MDVVGDRWALEACMCELVWVCVFRPGVLDACGGARMGFCYKKNYANEVMQWHGRGRGCLFFWVVVVVGVLRVCAMLISPGRTPL